MVDYQAIDLPIEQNGDHLFDIQKCVKGATQHGHTNTNIYAPRDKFDTPHSCRIDSVLYIKYIAGKLLQNSFANQDTLFSNFVDLVT